MCKAGYTCDEDQERLISNAYNMTAASLCRLSVSCMTSGVMVSLIAIGAMARTLRGSTVLDVVKYYLQGY